MSAFSNYLEAKLLGVTLLATPFTAPSTVYFGLATAVSTDGDLITEVSGGSYARRAGVFGAPASGAVSNSANVTFPQATANWGTVTHIVIYDALSGGNALYWSALDVPRAIQTNDTFVLPVGSQVITLD